MCGRYVLETDPDEVARFFGARVEPEVAEHFRPSWNIAPTRRAVAVATLGDGRVVGRYRWGLIPSWAKDPAIGNRLFNARSETAATKPSFRAAFTSRRLVVVANGFYEWHGAPGTTRQPWYLSRADHALLAFAGLFEVWSDPRPGMEPVRSCTILTTAANSDVAPVHERMPVVLAGAPLKEWLDPGVTDRGHLESLLVPAESGTLVRRPVSRAVGNTRVDSPELLAVVADGAVPPD